MNFDLDQAVAMLERTPRTLEAWLEQLPEAWVQQDEGPETWSAFDVVGHLIHGEKTDWLPRAEHILAGRSDVPFEPFDRFAMRKEMQQKSLGDRLTEFQGLRTANLKRLKRLGITEAQLDLPGLHPELGRVTLRQHLATWVAHDLTHLAQIARVMARRYTEDVGPWITYLPLLEH